MSKKQKVLLTVLVVGLGGTLAGFGVFSAFSSTTSNPGNTFAAGSVTLTDSDGDVSLFSNVTKARPGVPVDRCIRVSYAGTLDSTVKLYTSAITGDTSKVNVEIHKSAEGLTPVSADCTGFTADGGAVYGATTKTLANFSTDHSGWSNGLTVNPGIATKWVQNDDIVYRIRLTVPDVGSNSGASIDTFDLTWEAQNQ